MHAVVKDVEVCTVPFTVGDGEPWDLFSGPDLYYEAYGPDETCLHTSDVVNDVAPKDLPVALGGAFTVEARARYGLRLLDADLTGHEVVARINFAPGRLIEQSRGPDPPRTARLNDGETALRLTLAWARDES